MWVCSRRNNAVLTANQTIGTSALKGMLFITVFGLLLAPGLYYMFSTLAEGKSLVRAEVERSVTYQATRHV